MKKTIAILLVLVIGMVGVWADTTAELELTTTVTSYNLLAITDSATDTFDFDADPYVESLSATFDVENAFDSPVIAAYLHYKTNNAGPVTLKISGAALVNDGDGAFMPYTLTCGNASISTTNATPVESINNVFNYAQTGLETASLPINVQITEGDDLDDYTAGTYSTTVSFIFTAS